MSDIQITAAFPPEATLVPNLFIEYYMPQANGEFVKAYLYLLRALTQTPPSFSLAQGADALNCTERDLLRGLKYWEKEGLLRLTPSGEDAPVSVTLLPIPAPAPPAPVPAADEASAGASAAPPPLPAGVPGDLTNLLGDDEFRQLLFITEQYLNRTLSPTDSGKLAYFYDELGLSGELLEYLIEYCVSKGKKNIHYIERIALAWAEKGITTVEQAKRESSAFQKDYFVILRALGVRDRAPVESELLLMDKWLNDCAFPLEVITEACSRTVLQTGRPSFPYADKILSDWQKQGVRTAADIAAADAAFQQKAAKPPQQPVRRPEPDRNRFNRFHQREYDYEEYERQLLTRR